MKEAIAKLGKHSLVYGVGNIATKLVAFLLLPIYTKYLTPDDYGVLQICNTLSALLLVVYQMGMTSSLFKVYYNVSEEDDKKTIFSSVFFFYLLAAGGLSAILISVRTQISSVLITVDNSSYLFLIVVISVYIEGALNLGLAILRAKEKSTYYSLVNVLRVFFYAGFNILFVVVYRRNYIGVREGTLLSIFVALLFLLPIVVRNIHFKISREYLKEVLHLGIPLAIGGLALWVITLTDRYMLRYLLPDSEALYQVGLYSLGNKFAMLIKYLLVFPFSLSWGALMFAYQNHPEAQKIYSRVMNIFCFAGGVLILLFSLFSRETIHFIASNSGYYPAWKVVPVLAFSGVFSGTASVLNVGVTLKKHTKYISISNITAAATNIVLNVLLIPQFGMMGAAYASLISFILINIMMYRFSQKDYFIPYQTVRIVSFFVFIAVMIFVVNMMVHIIWIKVVIFILLLFILPQFSLVSYSEINRFLRSVKSRLVS